MVTNPVIWPNGRFGVPQITPYTYRDAHSLLELITGLRDHVVDQLHPNLQSAIDQLVVEVEEEYGDALEQYVNGIQEFQRIHDAFMADVNAHLIALNDGSVSDLLNDETSLIYRAVRDLISNNPAFTEMDKNFQNHRDHVQQAIDEQTKSRGLTPYDFGAVGDGEADDTVALQAWVDNGAENFSHGVFLVTSPINVNADNVKIRGAGNVTLTCNTTRTRFFSVNGDNFELSGVTVEGNNFCERVATVFGEKAVITNNNIRNLFSPVEARAFHLSGDGGYVVTNNVIENVNTSGVGDMGAGTGMSRAVVIHKADTGDVKHHSVVSGNTISHIYGQEGDSVTVSTQSRTGGTRYSANVTISDNVFNAASRRFIKTQASDVTITNNTLLDTTDNVYDTASTCIACINGSGIIVTGNTINANRLLSHIRIYATEASPVRVLVSGNTIYNSGKLYCVQVEGITRVQVSNNSFHVYESGMAVSLKDVNHGTISANSAYGTNTASNSGGRVYLADSNCRYIMITGNTASFRAPREEHIVNNSYGGVTQGNYSW